MTIPKPEGPAPCPTDPAWHRAAYTAAVRAIMGDGWRLDGIGEREAIEHLAGWTYRRFLDGATEAEATGWYRATVAKYIAFQRDGKYAHLTLYRPAHFAGYLERWARDVTHAHARKPASVAPKEVLPVYEYLPAVDTKECADAALTALGSLFPGILRGTKPA